MGADFVVLNRVEIDFGSKKLTIQDKSFKLFFEDQPLLKQSKTTLANYRQPYISKLMPYIKINLYVYQAMLLLDTGAQISVIYQRVIPKGLNINSTKKLTVEDINGQSKETLGRVTIMLCEIPTIFHVVDETFDLPGDGILGVNFFHLSKAKLNFESLLLNANNYLLEINIGKTLADPYEMNLSMPPELNCDFYDSSEDNKLIELIDLIPDSCIFTIQKEKQLKDFINVDKLDETEKLHVQEILNKYSDIFHIPGEKLPGIDKVQHHIATIDEKPINVKQYKYPHALKDEVNKQVQEMLKNGVIKESESPYNNPLWVVEKKPDAEGNKRWRIVLDFRALNEKTLSDAYPLPDITQIFDQVGSAKYYSVLDLAWGFWQIKLHPDDTHKCAFSTPFGHYEFSRMAFGLKNAPATFQRLMDNVLKGLQGNILFVYLDDIVIYANSLEEHDKKFELLANRLRDANLKLQPEKCNLLERKVRYLGHILSEEGLQVDPKKTEAVVRFPTPKTVKNVRQFIGLAGYYRRFIEKFATIAKPLFKLLQKDTPFIWNEKAQKAFDTLKTCLTTTPVLAFPKLDEPYNITTDASGYAVGGVLSQGEPGKDRPIAYTSRALRGPELNYEVYEKEALAIIHSVEQFHSYIYNRKITIYTDHQPLVWFKTADLNTRVQKWRFKISVYDYSIVYKKGKLNVNADSSSRNVPEELTEQVVCSLTRSELKENENIQNIDENSRETVDAPRKRGRPPKNLQKPKPNIPARNPSKRVIKPPEKFDPSNYIKPPEPNPKTFEIPPSESEKSDDSDSERESTDDEEQQSNEAQHLSDDAEQQPDEVESQPISNDVEQQLNPDNIDKLIPEIVYSKNLMHCLAGNIAYFIDTKSNPCDAGAKKLAEFNKLPRITDINTNEVHIFESSKKTCHFVLCIKNEDDIAPTTCKENILFAMSVLRNLLEKRNQTTIFCTKTNTLYGLSWDDIVQIIMETFENTKMRIVVCTGEITYVPISERDEIFYEMHSSAIGGHRGVSKTYNRIKKKYLWENLKNYIQRRIQQCLDCQLKKLVRVKTRQPMLITDTPGIPFYKIALDIVGPLPKSKNNFEYILTMQDNFSKFCLAVPLVDITAVSVADAFIKRFISIFGSPKVILTDQGSNFMSSLMKRLPKRFKIKQIKTTPYHAQSNGSLECSHHVLKEFLKQYTVSDDAWDEWVDLAILNYNTSVQESTKLTPYEIIFGRIANLPTSLPLRESDLLPTYQGYMKDLVVRLNSLQKIAYDNLVKSKFKSKKYYDARVNQKNFKPGDYIFLLSGLKGKKHNQYSGPFEILEVLQNNNVRLQIKNKSKVVHADRIRISYIYE
ncbi:hypothetical protein TKK_0014634 [Trichogramma kaykai]